MELGPTDVGEGRFVAWLLTVCFVGGLTVLKVAETALLLLLVFFSV